MNQGTSACASVDVTGTEAAHGASGTETSVSTSVVVAVAEADDVDPVEMDERLHDWVDPDALDAVVDSLDDGHVQFEMAGHRVRVDAAGEVAVDRPE